MNIEKRQLVAKVYSICAISLVIGLLAAGCGEKAPVPEKNANTPSTNSQATTLKVIVQDEATGKAIQNAEVVAPYVTDLSNTNRPHLLTDANGEAVLTIPTMPEQMQAFNLSVSHSNYAARSVMWISEPGNVLKTLPQDYTLKLRKGITIGGFVRDEQGTPLAGVAVLPWGSDYKGFSTGETKRQEYAEVSVYVIKPTLTDSNGMWVWPNFPGDLGLIRINVTRPGGALSQFTTATGEDYSYMGQGTKIPIADLRATNALFKLSEGYTIHGRVCDPQGNALSNVRLKARGGNNQQTPPYAFTNNTDGTFTLSHWVVPQLALMAECDGYASKVTNLSERDSQKEKLITMRPVEPLKIRVIGDKDEPLAGARLQFVDWRSHNQSIDWAGVTDAKGTMIWTNPPEQPAAFWVFASNYPVRAVKLQAGPKETVVKLRKGSDKEVAVEVKALDAESGKPIPEFEVHRQIQWGQGFSLWGKSEKGGFKKNIASSEFRNGTVPSLKIQIRSKGYAYKQTEDIYFDEGDQSLEFKLDKAALTDGTVLQPNGEVAEGATVMLNTGQGSIFANSPDRYSTAQGTLSKTTGTDGHFVFESAEDENLLVIKHPAGFAMLTVGDLHATNTVKLQPWATLKVSLRVEGKPLVGQQIGLRSPPNWAFSQGFLLSYSATTDEDGSVTFTNLPPGHYAFYRSPFSIMGKTTVESHRLCFDLAPGESKQLRHGFGGRRVIGQMEADDKVDWMNDPHFLEVVLPKAAKEPNFYDYLDNKEYQKARKAYARSAEALEYDRKVQQFQLVFNKDGSFVADDVPPGKYEIRIRVTEPPSTPGGHSFNSAELGTFKKTVEIPAGDGPFDLGSMSMEIQSKQPAGARTPVTLNALSLDGKPFSSTELKNKTAVLVFWAPWSHKSLDGLEQIKALQKDWAKDERITVVSVCIDEDSSTARQLSKQHSYDWTQTYLCGTNLVKASADFQIINFPTICILDQSGCLAASSVSPERLQTTVKRTLKNVK